MSKRSVRMLVFALLVGSIVGCGPTPGRPTAAPNPSSSSASPSSAPAPTLAVAIRLEPTSLAAMPLQRTGVTLGTTLRLFNAGLAITDDHGQAIPYLAAALPALNTDSWKVSDDGRMETTYTLRPNLRWHDGHQLTADDFVFSYEVYTNPTFGLATTAPQGLMDEVLAPDDRTLTIRWKQPYPFAGVLEATTMQSRFPPLPRHLLQAPMDQLTPDALLALPFWTTEYVGAGPFKLDRWQPGSAIDASAFSDHALGQPKIGRVELRFINDANTALSNMLSGAVQLLADDAIYFQQAAVLKRQWESSQAGRIVVTAGLWRYEDIQLGAEYNRAPALFDSRVRKALAYSLDREAINTGVYDGEGIIADSVIPPTSDYFAVVDRALTKYPFDPRRTEQLMAEAGFTKGSDGVYTSPASGRLSLELKVTQSPQNESEQQIMAARWRELGFAIDQAVLPAAQAQDGQARATFPALYTNSTPAGDSMIALRGTANIPRAENRWNGPNRGHWTNADFDRLAAAYTRTLERDQRIQQIAQMLALISDELPTISINFNPGLTAFSSGLQGPAPVGPDSVVSWNIQNWQLH